MARKLKVWGPRLVFLGLTVVFLWNGYIVVGLVTLGLMCLCFLPTPTGTDHGPYWFLPGLGEDFGNDGGGGGGDC